MNATNQIVHVPFNGQTIDAALDEKSGAWLVALRPICENVGVAFNAQYERLNRQPWATIRMTRTVGADGKQREMVMVDRQTLVMWLATIDTSRVRSDEARAVVVAYQRECAKVLDAYFMPTHKEMVDASQLLADPDFAVRTFTALKEARDGQARAERRAQRLLPKALVGEAVEPSAALYTLPQVTKLLQNVAPSVRMSDVKRVLRDSRMMCRCSREPTHDGIKTGRLAAVYAPYTDRDGVQHDGVTYSRVTGKGLAWLVGQFAGQAQAAML